MLPDPLSRQSYRDTEEGKVLHALGLDWAVVPGVMEDPECRPIVSEMMSMVRGCAAELNQVISRAF